MDNSVLWRRLTETDFNAMHGKASPHGRGGGAMHIALGVGNQAFPIGEFLMAGSRTNVTLKAAATRTGKQDNESLSFSSNPSRRGGEWLIRDQFTHRHPAWTPTAGFPTAYDPNDTPYVLIFRVGNTFHARSTTATQLAKLQAGVLPEGILTEAKGIRPASVGLLEAFSVPHKTLVETLAEATKQEHVVAFDPKGITDGRQRIIASILQRQGQQAFRRRLLKAYAAQCAVTRCTTEWVLEAAHITPYRGIKTNALSNGLLLRADVHTLFDLALIAIEPARMRIRVSSLLDGSQYTVFDGKVPALPARTAVRPSGVALEEHYSLFHR